MNLQFPTVIDLCIGIWKIQILMWQNLNFKNQQKIFLIEMKRDPCSIVKFPAQPILYAA